MRSHEAMRSERGFVAIEFALSIGLLLLPVLLIVAALPSWVERQHAATVAAREAASAAAGAYPADGREAGRTAATEAVANYGIPPADVDVSYDRDEQQRGGMISARVTIAMPAIVVPGLGTVGGFHWSVVHTRRIDDYRSG
jgi:Flp pilus assembly protein TadG